MGKNGKPVGCRPFFQLLGMENAGGDHLLKSAKELVSRVVGDKSSEDGRETSSLYDRLVDLIAKLNIAMNSPEYVHCRTAWANRKRFVSSYAFLFR